MTSTHTADPAPVLTQGTIQPGTYYLTSYTLYDGATGANISIAETVKVTVNNKIATLNEVDTRGITNTIDITMGTPATAAPSSIIATCSTDPSYQTVIGQELKAVASYGVTGTGGDTLTVYISTLKLKQVYKLQP